MDQQQAFELGRTLNIAGGILGGLIGCFGGLIGYLAPRGKARRFVLGGMLAFMGLGVGALITGAILAMRGLPFVVYWPVLLMGIILSCILAPMYTVVRKRYSEAESRRMAAAALRAS